jgi:hypothetical protein
MQHEWPLEALAFMGEASNPPRLHNYLCRRTTLAGSPIRNTGSGQRELALALFDA